MNLGTNSDKTDKDQKVHGFCEIYGELILGGSLASLKVVYDLHKLDHGRQKEMSSFYIVSEDFTLFPID